MAACTTAPFTTSAPARVPDSNLASAVRSRVNR